MAAKETTVKQKKPALPRRGKFECKPEGYLRKYEQGDDRAKKQGENHPTSRVALTGSKCDHFNTLRIPPGSLILVTDIPTYELEPGGEKEARADVFTLTATDGSYERTLKVKENHVSLEDWVDLVFEDLPTRARYTLRAKLHGEEEVVIFEDVPYAKLSLQTRDLAKQESDPRKYGEY